MTIRTKPWTKWERYLLGACRKAWQWFSEARKECLKAKTCLKCGKTERLYADHITPVVDIKKGWQGWDTHIDRMMNGALQPLCKECHNKKSKAENAERRKRGK